VLDDRQAEPGAARGARPIAAIEALEETGKLFLLETAPVVGRFEQPRPHAQRQRRARARVPDRVLGKVLRDHVEHPSAQGQSGVGRRRVEHDLDVRMLRTVGEPVTNLFEYRERRRRAERHDLATAFELGQEQDVVDELAHLLEDDAVIADGMARHLAAAGFDPVVTPKGDQGLARLRFESPDVVVLDLMLPGRDGWSVIEAARAEGIGTPIVVVSARGTEHDRVHALEIGADDYLVKPFSMNELVARVRAASRRATRRDDAPRGEPIEIEELRVDPREVQAYVDGQSAELTPTEFRLLYQLALERGRVVTRDELLQKLWGRRETHRDRTVDVFIRRLRDKIDRRADEHTFIQTRYGVGYRLEPVPKNGRAGQVTAK
jgi:DNA-binding response OmpR family regulator